MTYVKFLGNGLKNIFLEYGEVEISISIKTTILQDEKHLEHCGDHELDVDSIMLTHYKFGNISKLYNRCEDIVIYPEFQLGEELRHIFKFIDKFNEITARR